MLPLPPSGLSRKALSWSTMARICAVGSAHMSNLCLLGLVGWMPRHVPHDTDLPLLGILHGLGTVQHHLVRQTTQLRQRTASTMHPPQLPVYGSSTSCCWLPT